MNKKNVKDFLILLLVGGLFVSSLIIIFLNFLSFLFFLKEYLNVILFSVLIYYVFNFVKKKYNIKNIYLDLFFTKDYKNTLILFCEILIICLMIINLTKYLNISLLESLIIHIFTIFCFFVLNMDNLNKLMKTY